MRVLIRPHECPHLPVDVTSSLVAAIARELSRVSFNDDEQHWAEAELLLSQMIGQPIVGPVRPPDRHSPRLAVRPPLPTTT